MIAAAIVLVATGAILMALVAFAAFRLGRSTTDTACLQLRQTARDMMVANKAGERQIARIRDDLNRIILDPRTHAHTKLELERSLDLTAERRLAQ